MLVRCFSVFLAISALILDGFVKKLRGLAAYGLYSARRFFPHRYMPFRAGQSLAPYSSLCGRGNMSPPAISSPRDLGEWQTEFITSLLVFLE